MDNLSGAFTVVGSLRGSDISFLTTKLNQDWRKAKNDVDILVKQLNSYSKLEELYIQKIFEMDKISSSAITVKKKNRDEVEVILDYEKQKLSPTRLKTLGLN